IRKVTLSQEKKKTLAAVYGPLPSCAAVFAVAPPSASPPPPSSSTVVFLSPTLVRFELTWFLIRFGSSSLRSSICYWMRWSGSSLRLRRCFRRCVFLCSSVVHSFIVVASLLLLCPVFVSVVGRLC
ncbi:hypothetical protein U1Q18_023383, partial [Sarracenia purpurea var. burkii]